MTENAKTYSTPKLDRFGTMADLTAAGSGTIVEASGNGDMMGDMMGTNRVPRA